MATDTFTKINGKDIAVSEINKKYSKEELKEMILQKETFLSDVFLLAGFEKLSKEREDVFQRLFDDFGGLVYPIVDENQTIHLLDSCGNDHFSYSGTYEEYIKK